MGFQDRDYNHEPYDDHGYRPKRGGPMSITMRLVILNIALWLVNGLFFSENNLLSNIMALQAAAIRFPEYWWKFVTYGFAHSPDSPFHIIGNMICLIMFGYGMMLGIGPGGFALVRGENVEERLGRFEYLVFYLLTIIVGGVVYCLVNWDAPRTAAWGASGGCVGVIILYALLFPNKMMLLFGVIPMPMWALGLLIVFSDAYGAAGYGTQGIAFSIHLSGAAFALFYYFFFLSRRRKITGIFSMFGSLFKRKPKLNVYHGDEPTRKSAKEEEYERRLDAILDRYGKVGEAGLTNEEREFLKQASKKYRNR